MWCRLRCAFNSCLLRDAKRSQPVRTSGGGTGRDASFNAEGKGLKVLVVTSTYRTII